MQPLEIEAATKPNGSREPVDHPAFDDSRSSMDTVSSYYKWDRAKPE
jgi:hypothetical protein